MQSVLSQTFSDFEIIIVNDGSTDGSEQVIKSFDDKRIKYYTQKNQGAGAARNAAIEKATATYIALMDADDYWYPHYLEEQYRLIKKYPEEFVFATAQEIINFNKTYPKTYSLPKDFRDDGVINYFKAGNQSSLLHSSSTVLKKEVFKQVGNYNPSIKSGQDTDLYIRVGLRFSVAFSKKICSSYYVLENSLFRSSKSLDDKIDFSKYELLEKENPDLKKFLDLNRFSLAIFAKLHNDSEGFRQNFEKIDLNNLNKKQRFLLRQPVFVLRMFHRFKSLLLKSGIQLSAFR